MVDHDSQKSSAQLEREVELQRSRVSSTIDQIQDQLSPGQLVDQVMSLSKGGAGEFAQNLGRTITANPLPVALMGASLIWLISGKGTPRMHASHHHDRHDTEGYGYGTSDALRSQTYGNSGHGSAMDKAKALGSGVGDKLSDVGDKVSDTIGGVKDKMSGMGDSMGRAADKYGHRLEDAQDSLSRTMHDARHTAMRTSDSVARMIEEQPLVAGAVAFAVGAAIGALAPRTRQEDELMGAASDQVKHAVQETAEPLIKEGKHAIEEGKHAIDEGKAKLEERKAKLDEKLEESKARLERSMSDATRTGSTTTPGSH